MKHILSKSQRSQLTNYLTSWISYHTGQGPKLVKVSSNSEVIIVKISGFLTPLEKTLIYYCGAQNLVREVRQVLLSRLLSVWSDIGKKQFGFVIKSISGEVNYYADEVILTCKVEKLGQESRFFSLDEIGFDIKVTQDREFHFY